MPNPFDNIQSAALEIVTTIFGSAATWIPANGDPVQSAIVLYKDATESHGLSDVEFTIERFVMEYRQGQFTGLREAVGKGETERVSIELTDGISNQFIVRRTETKFDGKTILAFLSPIQ